MRIAISGTYSTGKTTTTEALALLTGIPRTQARTMREILPDAVPGKDLEQCTPAELIQLGIWRFKERAINESHAGETFFSDGSCLHEWVYGKARMTVGINPNLGPVNQWCASVLGMPVKRVFADVIENMGNAVKQHAKQNYDEFIHLPVEFPLVKDGHRPVSERFRTLSDEILLSTLDTLRIPYQVVGGSIENRLEKIVALYDLPQVMSIDDAVTQAKAKVSALNAEIAQEALSRHVQQPSVRRNFMNLLSRI
ncbi:AAA family ATPase [Photobacterium sp. 1_MG-2023]|uniref:AAA family ATPase n=1 Tax=Photobacterium sp. 1_MG-2023 TaxID=3062646 RepID=UPI0026E3F652|nr:AAA family ATPase [Photobacterium sp. 1_MG-2023]MDO6707320.1 AAA family ATPase [Photobacterium sp. 1_MG-2023]